jgi:hypothetical protein
LNKYFLYFLLLSFSIKFSFSQIGSIELNSGGFSFVPIFTSDKPHMIFRGSTNNEKRLSLNLIHLIMLDGLTPSNYMLTARYKIFDKKFKLFIGTEFLGGYRVLKNEEYKSRNVHEVRLSHLINSKTKLSFLYMHGQGRNFEMSNNFYAFYFQKKLKKITASSQVYALYSSLLNEPMAGVAQKVSVRLKDKIILNLFVNSSIAGEDYISNKTIGLEFFL